MQRWMPFLKTSVALAAVLIIGLMVGCPTQKPVSQAALVNKLAMGVVQARTGEARYNALLEVMRAMHVGVYTEEGKESAPGAARPSPNLYVYDFELRIMAGALERNEDLSLEELSLLLVAPSPDVSERIDSEKL